MTEPVYESNDEEKAAKRAGWSSAKKDATLSALRMALYALAFLFALAASAVALGAAWASFEEGELPLFDQVLILTGIVLGLSGSAFLLFRASQQVEEKRLARLRAELESADDDQLFCPHCDESALVQGALERSWPWTKSHVARCITCGYGADVSRQEWRRLPLPETDDPFETDDDREHRIRRSPMTTGQGVVVAIGTVGFIVVAFELFEENERRLNLIMTIAFLPVVFALWRFGQWLFPPSNRTSVD